MKIAMIISSLSFGGAERVCVNMANWFNEKGHKVIVFTRENKLNDFYNLPTEVVREELNISKISKNKLEAFVNNINRIRVIRKTIRNTQPDIVISFLTETNVIVVFSLLGLSIPIIVTEHCDPRKISPGFIWEKLRWLAYKMSTCLVSVSKGVNNYFSYLPKEQRCVIYNPLKNIELDKTIKTYEFLKNGKKNIVAMGRLDYQKGFDLLIKAFAMISDKLLNWNIVILGEGSCRTELEILVKHYDLKNRVFLPGVFSPPFTVLNNCDLFVMSSRSEGFGNVLVEAMSCGLPVISFDCPSGPREIIRNGIDGILVPAENVDALSNTMQELMKDKEKRTRLGKKALEVRERFNLDKIMKQWENIINKVKNHESV